MRYFVLIESTADIVTGTQTKNRQVRNSRGAQHALVLEILGYHSTKMWFVLNLDMMPYSLIGGYEHSEETAASNFSPHLNSYLCHNINNGSRVIQWITVAPSKWIEQTAHKAGLYFHILLSSVISTHLCLTEIYLP